MVENASEFFARDYATARQAFCDAVKMVGGAVASYIHPLQKGHSR